MKPTSPDAPTLPVAGLDGKDRPGDANVCSTRGELEKELLEFFVRAAQLAGQPKSLGEIYGLLYFSEDPLSMEEIVARLGISLGSASQGLRQLRAFKAVRAVAVPGQRKDYFVAEIKLRRVIAGFVQEEIKPHMESGLERLARLEELAGALDDVHLQQRVRRLARLHEISGQLLPLLMKLVRV